MWQFSGSISAGVRNNLISKSYDTVGSDSRAIISLNSYLDYDNMLVEYDGKKYRLHISLGSNRTHDVGFTYDANSQVTSFVSALTTYMSSDSQYAIDTGDASTNKLGVYTTYQELLITAEEVLDGVISVTFPETRIRNNSDVFDVFMIPYHRVRLGQYNPNYETSGIYNDQEAAMAMALRIAKDLGGQIYDLQVLPYCPINQPLSRIVWLVSKYFFSYVTENYDYVWIKKTVQEGGQTVEKNVSMVYFPQSNNFTSFIQKSQTIDITDSEASSALNAKIENECVKYRLCSPNYNGIFEYSLAKNGCTNGGFNIYCTYKPFTPYIKLNPLFAGLYGSDFSDSTGLICGGDFSLGIINDQWVNYQIQNKNFQAMFDRQVQSMDVEHSIAKQEAIWQLGAGAVQGAASGAAAGGMAGGVYGAAAGAVVGGVTSLAGGIADYANLNKRLANQRGLTLDMHKYELGNVQALPKTITKSSALTANNKIWPVLEKISCTDAEKEMFKKQLEFDGESIGAVGTIADYMTSIDFSKSFVKGQLIRIEGISEDAHMLDEIFAEIKQGVYF